MKEAADYLRGDGDRPLKPQWGRREKALISLWGPQGTPGLSMGAMPPRLLAYLRFADIEYNTLASWRSSDILPTCLESTRFTIYLSQKAR